jgi:hypothetical protein
VENPHSLRDDELMQDFRRVPPKDSKLYTWSMFSGDRGGPSVRLLSPEALVDSTAKFIRAWEPKLSWNRYIY